MVVRRFAFRFPVTYPLNGSLAETQENRVGVRGNTHRLLLPFRMVRTSLDHIDDQVMDIGENTERSMPHEMSKRVSERGEQRQPRVWR